MSEEQNIEHTADDRPQSTENEKISEPSIINELPLIENMEVHKHPHHITHKKKWGEYLLEFLMLFLAVFLGFIAENIREQSVERHHEKQFVESFIQDLRTDTASIRQILIFRQVKLVRMDSLILLLSNEQIKGHENDLYFFGRTLVRTLWFRSNDRTITQLKNSGSLRLIRNEQAADSMMSYQKLVETIMSNQEDDHIERIAAGPLLSRIYNAFEFDKMVTINGINRPDGNPPLRSYDQNHQQDLAYYIHQLKGSNFIIQARLELLNDKAKNMITFLQKEYHLKNE